MNRKNIERNFLKRKWLNGECRHLCLKCEFTKQCEADNFKPKHKISQNKKDNS